MKKLALLIFAILILGCGSKPNQTVYNRPNAVFVWHHEDFENYSIDSQLNSVAVSRPLRSDEEWAGYPEDKWIRTADVIKPMESDILADKGLPTGIYHKQLFSSDYECFVEPLKVKGNIIRLRVTGSRHGGVNEYQLTLTVKNHATLAEAKQALLERVNFLYDRFNWGFDMHPVIRQRILYEAFVYPSDQERWQAAPDANFKYHQCTNYNWMTPPNDNIEEPPVEAPGGWIYIAREPLSENGYRWGDPFVIRVMFAPHGP